VSLTDHERKTRRKPFQVAAPVHAWNRRIGRAIEGRCQRRTVTRPQVVSICQKDFPISLAVARGFEPTESEMHRPLRPIRYPLGDPGDRQTAETFSLSLVRSELEDPSDAITYFRVQ